MNTVIPIFAPEHRIKSVTIFKSTNLAEVVRVFELELKPGTNRIEITGLPSVLDSESVRVTGLGTGALRLHDVVCTKSSKDSLSGAHHALVSMNTEEFLANIPELLDSAERIRLLRAHLKTLEGEKEIRDHESSLLVSYAKTLQGEHIKPEQMGAFLSTFVETNRKSLVAVREIDEMLVAVKRRIELEEEKLAKRKGTARAKVEITIGNTEKGNQRVALKLTYIVKNARWDPTYELHAHTSPATDQPSSQVTLHYRASIIQSTGEDWTDAALILSTGSSIKPPSKPTSSLFGNIKSTTHPTPVALPFSFENSRPKPLFGSNPTSNAKIGGGFSSFGNLQPSAPSVFGQPAENASTNTNPSLFGSTATFGSTSAFGSGSSGGLFSSSTGASTFGDTSSSQPTDSGSGFFGGSNTSSFTANATHRIPQQQQQRPPPGASEIRLDSVADDFEEITVEDLVNPATEVGDVPLSQTQTAVTKTPITISDSVEGLVSIPSDGVKHHVGVAVLTFGSDKGREDSDKESVKIEYGVVPRVDARVYLQCRIKNTSEYTMLSGPIIVILNDIYVARTNMSHISPNGIFTCTLGSDSTTSVTYRRSSKILDSSFGPFAESFKTTAYTTTVTLRNRHAFDLKEIRVWDAVPMWTPVNDADKKRVSIVLRKPHGLADAKDGETVVVKDTNGNEKDNVKVVWEKEKEGKFYWNVRVKAGQSEQLVLEWEVKAPSDLALVESYGDSLFGAA